MALARRWTRRLLRASLYVLVAVLLLSAILRTATYLYRLRAEHLMADLQSLQLRHSTWPEAQRLITRWGRYGHYEGTCDASFCRYTISLESPGMKLEDIVLRHTTAPVLVAPPTIVTQLVGGREAMVKTTFVVQDGIVLRKGAVFTYGVVEPFGAVLLYALVATTRADSRLTTDAGGFESYNEQLAHHPFYAATRPSGCTVCMMANVTFTPDIPADQLRPLTTFDFSCLTRFRQCHYIEDIYPASAEWHLYGSTNGIERQHADTPLPLACRVPVSVRGREATQIFSVTVIDESQHIIPYEVDEVANVRLKDILKGESRNKTGDVLRATSTSTSQFTPLQIETPLAPGKDFLLISRYPVGPGDPFELDRCSVLSDTPENRTQLQQGIAQNDNLHHPDPRPRWWGPE